MKTYKLTKGVQIILATVFVLVITGIVVGILSNDNAFGASVTHCTSCITGSMSEYTKSNNNGTHTTGLRCSSCGATESNTTSNCSANYVGTTSNNNGTHTNKYKCSTCGYISSKQISCTYEISGYLTDSESHTIKRKCTSCGYSTKGATAKHDGGTHANDGVCAVCEEKYQTHTTSVTGYRSTGNGAHVQIHTCSFSGCNYSTEGATEGCSGGTHANGGKCTKCEYQYQVHKMENTGTCKSNGNGTHKLELKCTVSSCNYTDYGAVAQCIGGTHANGGKCEVCNDEYQKHTSSVTGYRSTGNGAHVQIHTCSLSGCNYSTEGATEGCSGGTHDNRGMCTKCGERYQEHGAVELLDAEYLGNGRHKLHYRCAVPGCDYGDYVSDNTDCSGGSHSNGGVCEYCGGVYQKHEVFSSCRPSVLEGYHVEKFECSYEDCGYEEAGDFEKCTGGNHENNGECTKCGQKYQSHSSGEGSSSYKSLGNGKHQKEILCNNPECGLQTFVENCSGGQHENGGMCDFCHTKYQSHELTIFVQGYVESTDSHGIFYRCQIPNCGYEDFWGYENCSGMCHENGGVCKICGIQKLDYVHQPTLELVDFELTSETHIPLYSCTSYNCDKTFRGRVEEHDLETFTDELNGTHVSTCSICSYTVVREHRWTDEESQENSGYSTGSRRSILTYATRDALEDGTCIDCGALASAANNGCEHIYVEKTSETQHWEECTKCGYLKQGSLHGHEYGTYIDNEDGTHSATCTGCEYKITKSHYYEEGICVECNSATLDECAHAYILKSDETNHWHQCSKCNESIENTSENHEFGTYINNDDGTHTTSCMKCNYKLIEEHSKDCDKCATSTIPGTESGENNDENDGGENDETNEDSKNEEEKKDNTIINTIIPNAGKSGLIILGIIALIIISNVVKSKINKYKDI